MNQQPTASQSDPAKKAIIDLHAQFQPGLIELKSDYDGDLYLSVPVGDSEAVEIETYSTPSVLFFTLHHRVWDRTGGLSHDEELGETSKSILIKDMLTRWIMFLDEESKKAEAELEAAFGPGE